MLDDESPIAWPALEKGTAVYSRDGEELGKVSDVIADRQKDIFSGITFKPGFIDGPVFVPANKIERITTGAVRLDLATGEVADLERYEA